MMVKTMNFLVKTSVALLVFSAVSYVSLAIMFCVFVIIARAIALVGPAQLT